MKLLLHPDARGVRSNRMEDLKRSLAIAGGAWAVPERTWTILEHFREGKKQEAEEWPAEAFPHQRDFSYPGSLGAWLELEAAGGIKCSFWGQPPKP